MCASAATPASPRRIEVVAKRFAFEPAEITVKKGEAIDLVLTSADVAHGVRIRELNLDLRAGKGKQVDQTITPDKVGTFVGHCSVFCGSGHGQMALTIHVVALTMRTKILPAALVFVLGVVLAPMLIALHGMKADTARQV